MQTIRIPRSLAAWLLALGLLLAGVPALATTYYVANSGNNTNEGNDPASPKLTIQAAINATSDYDTVIVSDGIYTGFGNKGLDFHGKKITVRSASNNPALCLINCEGNGSGFIFHNSETSAAVVSGFTIQHASNSGMVNNSSSPTVTNCTFSGNSAFGGGGMDNDSGSSPTVTNCTFSGNSSRYGGGMANEGSSSPTVTNCTFSGNRADDYGGGMDNESGSSPTVTNCTFSGNSAFGGGGMANQYGSSPTVTNCTFSGNSTGYGIGGGMYNSWYSRPTVTNCTFSGNRAFNFGGGMFNDSSNPTVTNCTFSTNSAGDGGGMVNWYSSSPTLTNCILWGDSGGEIHNIHLSPTVTYSDVQGGYPGTGNFAADPGFLNAATGDLRLQPTSPCINAGDNRVVTSPPFLTNEEGILVDLDGNPRIQSGIVDMGAYEASEVPTSTVSGTITLEGSINQAQPLFFSFRNVAGGALFSRSLVLDADGTFSLNDIPRGRYSVWIKGTKWLAKSVVIDTRPGDVTTVNTVLLVGDVDNDNFIDVLDLATFIPAFDTTFSDPNWYEGADLNCNGTVDVLDLDLLLRNFDTEGDF